ncbi:PLP-dependent aminotransferase family protein [Streptomyces sp. NBC_00859]|uniref:aminotransferase-like domain-containing protein n=1 Tax=Streptomyces sp. NBC_00859 TaxID=2903682 RepID=UPI00386F6743|nr:PLP-dependent aminotransferase family protein [Streptomyces sp. NBC_00859]WSZ86740.1 PLP-dependent aminotransferase family protein [Streptomyces sp. NBC_00859]
MHTTDDPWQSRYATRTALMVPSEVRALFAVAARPEIISLAGGMPDVGALPTGVMADLVAALLTTHGKTALQYGTAQGDPSLRESICEVMSLEGVAADPDDVVVTVGSQQALDLVTRLFVDPGDTVVTEAPTYVTALAVFAAHQARVAQVEMDEEGVLPGALSETFARLAAQGRPAKLFYTIPTFHNPTGITMSARRRQEVLEVCRRARVLVLEDNPYGLLRYDGESLRPLRASAPDEVIYLGSFSKTLAPGLRVGWALAPPAVREKLVLAAESAMLSQSPLTQMTVDRYLRTQLWQAQLVETCTMYRSRRDAMLRALERYMPPGASWTVPQGGFFVWVSLPEPLDTKAMLDAAVAAGVAYVPGTGFYTGGRGRRELRLSFCYPTPEHVTEGVRRLAAVLQDAWEPLSAPHRIPVLSSR